MADLAEQQLDSAQLVYLQLLRDAGCKFLFRTYLFGKSYVWMQDKNGITFLERIPEDADTK